MNQALLYLWLALLRRRLIRAVLDLRRPAKLIGFLAPVGLIGFLFYYREEEFLGRLVRREALVGGGLIMLAGSIFKGFLERGLVFEPADVDFLFTGPFSQKQIVLYRLLPSYLYAVLQALVFGLLFSPHLDHPLLASFGLALFQIVCFHLATAAAIRAGALTDRLHDRIRWMLLALGFVFIATYLRVSLDIYVIPAWFAADWTHLLFYPAVPLADLGVSESLRHPILKLAGPVITTSSSQAAPLLWLPLLAGLVFGSLALVLKLKSNVFESSLRTTGRAMERRRRAERGEHAPTLASTSIRSAGDLPVWNFFRGAGAIVWKNLLCARRSRRQLLLAFVATLVFTLPLALILRYNAIMTQQNLGADPMDVLRFHTGVAIFLGSLALVLQRSLPFDFRMDGRHLVGFRTMPISPMAIVLAEITVPTLIYLSFQALGIASLFIYGRFSLAMLGVIGLFYVAVAVGINAIWNTHYLLSSARHISSASPAPSASAAGTLAIVALSFASFFPAGWMAQWLYGRRANPIEAAAVFVVIQGIVDVLLIINMARLFRQFEVARDS